MGRLTSQPEGLTAPLNGLRSEECKLLWQQSSGALLSAVG